jgi:hypothetical protein
MITFGTYRLTYTPPEETFGSVESTVDMSISSEADLNDMLGFFEDFLRATGYQLGNSILQLEEPPALNSSNQDFWEDDGVSLVGNPWTATLGNYGKSDQGIVFTGTRLPGGDDHLSFRSCFGSDVVTFS